MILRDVLLPGKELRCNVCSWEWVSISRDLPDFCANRECRSREWNGKKKKRKPRRAPAIEIPKPRKPRAGSLDTELLDF